MAAKTIKVDKTFEVKKKVRSGNEFIWSCWQKYSSYEKYFLKYIKAALGECPYGIPLEPVKIWITSYRKKMLDDDNLRTGCKPIPDSLKRLGWIIDDALGYIKIEYDQKYAKFLGKKKRRRKNKKTGKYEHKMMRIYEEKTTIRIKCIYNLKKINK